MENYEAKCVGVRVLGVVEVRGDRPHKCIYGDCFYRDRNWICGPRFGDNHYCVHRVYEYILYTAFLKFYKV